MDKFIGVLPPDLALGAYWPQIVAQLMRAAKSATWEPHPEKWRAKIESGEMCVLAVINERAQVEVSALCAVEVDDDGRREFTGLLIAGRKPERLKDAGVACAQALKCDGIRMYSKFEGVKRLAERQHIPCVGLSGSHYRFELAV
jgi:hypothetical protein